MAKPASATRAKEAARPSSVAAAAPATAAPAARVKVLIASHSHPELSKGGAEIAAFGLFTALNNDAGHEAWFLGCVRDAMGQKLGATLSQPFSEREFLYSAGNFDWFKFANTDPKFPDAFRELLRRLQPDVVHFHHFLNLGLEAFLHVRETLPRCRIVVTLHEYLGICHHFGQMITKQHRTLCYAASPQRCHACFEEIAPTDFFLRSLYIQRFFDLVDQFVAPSRFLADRYIAWNIPQERVTVLENVVVGEPATPVTLAATLPATRDLLRVGFFGQISPLKGITVLLDAAALLLERKNYHIAFEIHGDHSGQPAEFQEEFKSGLAKAGRNVSFHGPYDQARVDRLMQSMDVILVPSIWWENSPVVIQEARRNRRPVVCSDIGGMAEKVRDGIDGFHFPVGSSTALASLLVTLAKPGSALKDLAKGIRPPPAAPETVGRYLQLYASLLAV